MLDRLAKAAEEAAHIGMDWMPASSEGEPVVENWPEVVRAVLREMREPTAEMRKRGAPYMGELAQRGEEYAHACWSAMIDTILNEKTNEEPK